MPFPKCLNFILSPCVRFYNFSVRQFYILFILLILFLETLYLLMLSQVEYFLYYYIF